MATTTSQNLTSEAFAAAESNDVATLRRLGQNDHEIWGKRYHKSGRTLAFAAADNGALDVLQIIKRRGFRGTFLEPDEHNVTPLRVACFNGNLAVVNLIMEKIQDWYQKIGDHGVADLLVSAAISGHTGIVDRLIELHPSGSRFV